MKWWYNHPLLWYINALCQPPRAPWFSFYIYMIWYCWGTTTCTRLISFKKKKFQSAYHFSGCGPFEHDLKCIVLWICWIGNANGGVEAVDVYFFILSENFIYSLAAVIIAPCVITVKIAWFSYRFVSFIWYNSMAPSIVNQTFPIFSITCFRIT